MFNKVQRYSIRKLTVGAASVMIGAAFLAVNDNSKVQAAEKDNDDQTSQESADANKQAPVNATQVTKDENGNAAVDVKTTILDTKDSANAADADKQVPAPAPVQEAKTDTAATTNKENNVANADTTKATEQKNEAVATNTDKEQTTEKKDEKSDTVSVNIKFVNDTTGTVFGNPTLTGKKGEKQTTAFNFKGYKLLNPEALNGLTATNSNAFSGTTIILPDKDMNIVLHYAKLAPIEVDYVDDQGNRLYSYTYSATNSTDKSPYSDLDNIDNSKFMAYAINIPGYELVSDGSVETIYDKVLTQSDNNPQIIKFVYKKTQENAEKGLPQANSKGDAGNDNDGSTWNAFDVPFHIDLVNDTYGDSPTNYTKSIEEWKKRFPKQGSTLTGITNFHNDSDKMNRLEYGGTVNFVHHQNVVVKYVDEAGNEIATKEILSSNPNNPDQANNGITTDPSVASKDRWYPEGEWHSKEKAIDGYHLTKVEGATSGKFTVFQYTVTYVYAKNPVATTGTVYYIDDTIGKTLTIDNLTGNVGEKIDYNSANKIADYEKLGYELVSNNFKDGNEIFQKNGNNFEIHLKHGVIPVDPENPGKPDQPVNPNNPNGPKFPENSSAENLTKVVTRTINYKELGTNKKLADSVVQKVTFTGHGYIDKVTGKLVNLNADGSIKDENGQITWDKISESFDFVQSPQINGYHIRYAWGLNGDWDEKYNASQQTVNPDSPDGEINVFYGLNGSHTTSEFRNSTQTVNFVDDQGNVLHAADQQSFKFELNGTTIDNYTGEVLDPGSWNEDSHTYGVVNVPVIKGYVAVKGFITKDGKVLAGGLTATRDNLNVAATVVYKKIGNIVPQDPNGNPIPDPDDPSGNVPNTPYTNDPNDPTKVVPNEPVPNIPGYTPNTPTITPEDPTKDTPVVYDRAKTDGSVTYIDDTTGKTLKTDELSGKIGDQITYTTADKISSYEKLGYDLVSNNFKDGNETFQKDGNKFEVHLKHATIPVTPENPGKPDQPVNPDNPEGPKFPSGTDKDGLTKTITRTINYVDENGNKLGNKTQTATFTAQGVIDKVTGEWITPLTWSKSTDFDSVKSPVIENHYIKSVDKDSKDGVNVDGVTVDHTMNDYTVTVTYAPNGHIVPVDPSGNPIPDVDHPQFPTDPNDPTKTTDGNVPKVPGYEPKDGKPGDPVKPDPNDPGKDIEVPYVINSDVTISYIDDTTGKTLKSDSAKGYVGNKIDYTTGDKISNYEKLGYDLVSNNFKDGSENFVKGGSKFEVHLKHATIPVTPENPGKPDQPVNPDNPEGPKFPEGTDKTDLTKTVTRTINYVDENGKSVAKSVVQSVEFTAKGIIDKVTGEWITPLSWDGNKSFDGANTPVVENHYVKSISRDSKNGVNVDGVTVGHDSDSYTVTVTYAPNGHIVPVDPEGNPIPGVDYPQFPTDPNDPTKTTNGNVPKVPGYEPKEGKPGDPVKPDPNDPGKDIKVPYVINSDVTISYIDDTTGKTLNSESLTGNVGDKINYTTADKISNYEKLGYDLVSNNFKDGNESFVKGGSKFEIHLKHATVPVTPENPGKPNEPVNPDNPEGPKFPSGTDKDGLTKTVTRTVKYVDENGKELSKTQTQTFTFTKQGVIDKVTGEWVTPLTWNEKSHDFTGFNTPVVENHYVKKINKDSKDGLNVDGTTVTPDTESYVVTVTYGPNGHIVPVDPEGNPIPGVDHPQFPTDPKNPSKTTDGNVPKVPDYEPKDGNPGDPVKPDPKDPGMDVKVPYVKPDTPQPKPDDPVTPTPTPDPTPTPTPVDPDPVPQPHPEPTPDDPDVPDQPTTPDEDVDVPMPHPTDDPTDPDPDTDVEVPTTPEVVQPHASQVVMTPTTNTTAQEADPAPHAAVNADELPQTGSRDNTAAAVGLAITSAVGLIGLAGMKKRKD